MEKGTELHKLLSAREILALDERLLWERLVDEDREDVEKDIKKQLVTIAETIPSPEYQVYLNNNRKFGIESKHLKSFFFSELRDMFYGVNNIDIPYVMGMNLNEIELLAMYLGIGKIKRRNENNSLLFYPAIRQINNNGYKSKNILQNKKTGNNPHTINPGDLLKRLEIMPERIKLQFLESYREPLKVSYQEAEEQRITGYFHDPNWDGKNKELYVSAISRTLEVKYKKAKEKHLEEMKIVSMED